MKYIPISLVSIFCFVFGGIMFKSMTPLRCQSLQQYDSIFVLTGDARRIPYALKKLDSLQYGNLYIIGAGALTAIPNRPHINVESASKSTYQNAKAIKNIVEKTGLDRIVVVTTEDHMNRAEYLIRHELPKTEIVTCPATLYGMPATKRLERWTTEYIKYIVTLFGIKEG